MNEPQQFRKRPVEIAAMRMPTEPLPPEAMAVYQWVESHIGSVPPEPERDDDGNQIIVPGVTIDPADGLMMIRTLEGDMKVSLGDYVIRGVAGEFYPCKPDIFESTYDAPEPARKWFGYGTPADAGQWRLAAEWLECDVLHGGTLDGLYEPGESNNANAFAVAQRCTNAILDAADELEQGVTREACCYDRQRRNRKTELEMRKERNRGK